MVDANSKSTNRAHPRTVLFADYNILTGLFNGHSLISLIDHLDPARYRPAVVFNKETDVETAIAKRGVPTVIIRHGGGNPVKKAWEFGTLPIGLWRFARKIRPDLIHANNVMASRAAVILKAITGAPAIIQFRNTGIVPRLSGWMWKADHFAPVSRATLNGTVPTALHAKSTVVWDGLELANFPLVDEARRRDIRRAFGLPLDATIVGMAGRITRQKGINYFVEAARQITAIRPGVVFVHIGKMAGSSAGYEDEHERELMEMTRAMCADGKFFWLGYTDSMNDYWSAVDIAAAPSCGPEAFGRVLIEAMATACPVISTPSGGPEDVIDSQTGALVPMADSEKLAQAMLRWIDDPDERRSFGAAARRRVESVFSSQAYAQRIMTMYDKVLGITAPL